MSQNLRGVAVATAPGTAPRVVSSRGIRRCVNAGWRAGTGPRIGANGVKVPTYLYKLVYDATTNKAWAHWQENREGETVGRPISYQELVKRTGVEFLPRSALQHWLQPYSIESEQRQTEALENR